MPWNMLGKMSMLGITPMKSTGHHLQCNFSLQWMCLSTSLSQEQNLGLLFPDFFIICSTLPHLLFHPSERPEEGFETAFSQLLIKWAAHFVNDKESLQTVSWILKPEYEGIVFCITHSSKHCDYKCFKIIGSRPYISVNPRRTLPPVLSFFFQEFKASKEKKYMLQVSLLLPYTQHTSKQF